jgi:hypothetical protein
MSVFRTRASFTTKISAALRFDRESLRVGDPKRLTGLVERRAEVQRLRAEFATSERHACEFVSIPRTLRPAVWECRFGGMP